MKRKLTENIIEKWNEDKLVALIFLHKINQIYQADYNKSIILIDTRDGRTIDFVFENEKYALEGLKLLKEKVILKGAYNG